MDKLQPQIPAPVTFLVTKEAAKLMNVRYRTLEDWRLKGCGPVFRKAGRKVLYLRADILEYMDRCARRNTGGAPA